MTVGEYDMSTTNEGTNQQTFNLLSIKNHESFGESSAVTTALEVMVIRSINSFPKIQKTLLSNYKVCETGSGSSGQFFKGRKP